MIHLLKKYGGYFAALLISFLSIISVSEKPKFEEGKLLLYIISYIRYALFTHKDLIGWITIGLVLFVGIIIYFRYRPQQKFMNEACRYIRRNIDLASENEIQVSIFLVQSGWRTLLTYFKNVWIVLFNKKYWDKEMLKIYIKEKFPNVRKQYYMRMEQSKTKQSFNKPRIYFQLTYAEDEQNGYLSYYIANLGNKILSVEGLNFDYLQPKENLNNNQIKKIESYLTAAKLSQNDLRCCRNAANFIHIEPITNSKSEYIGALVIDITTPSKISATKKYENFIENAIKMINIAENNIE